MGAGTGTCGFCRCFPWWASAFGPFLCRSGRYDSLSRWAALRLIGLSAALITLSLSTCATELSVSDFQRATWTAKDGVPSDVWVMAQTYDGWLWLGGPYGLSKFDGVRVEEVKIGTPDNQQSSAVSMLYALPTGELVVGRARGGITILKGQILTNFDTPETRRAGTVYNVSQDADGALWASAANGLLRFDGRVWQLVGDEWEYPGGGSYGLMLDQHDKLWVASKHGVLFLAKGSHRFEATGIKIKRFGDFTQSPDGRLWLVLDNEMRLLPGQALTSPRNPTATARLSNAALFDNHGNFWNMAAPERPWAEHEVAGVDSLGTLRTTALEDTEGNVWIATGNSVLHRLSRPALKKVPWSFLSQVSLAADGMGNVWMGASSGFTRDEREGVWIIRPTPRQMQRGEVTSVTALATDSRGKLWAGGRDGLWRLNGSRFERAVELPKATRGEIINAISPNCADGLWVSVTTVGLLRHDGMSWHQNGGVRGLPAGIPKVHACDATGKLWLGYPSGSVAWIDKGQATVADRGPEIGAVTFIGIGTAHTLVAGEHGLALWQEGHFAKLQTANSAMFERVTGIVEVAGGDVWLNSAQGASRIRSSDLDAQRSSSAGVIPLEVFDASDGFPVPGYTMFNTTPSIALSGDGRVYFAGFGGIATLDETWSRPSHALLPVFIQSLKAAGVSYEPGPNLSLPEGTRSFQIEYTALRFSHPDRLRFRYRLAGIDDSWVIADARRQAFYSNLGPGTYRFVVNVTDENAVWTENFAALDFVIPPTFIQSRVFFALCVACVIALMALIYRLRIRQLTSRERLLADSRVKERERIARELHDTLLQGTQALILKVHGAARLSERGQPVHELLDEAIDRASGVMEEGRDRIQDLRLSDDVGSDLETSLTKVGEELSQGFSARFNVIVEGRGGPMTSDALQEAYRIGREALLNAFRHAKAHSVEVQIIFGNEDLRLRIRDDGVGIDEKTQADGSLGGHWGLPGMRERAQRIGAELSIWSRPGAGTEIELRVPAATAYVKGTARRR